MANNNISETDVQKYEVGPALKGLIMFIILAITFGGSWYLCKKNTKGDISSSEIKVRKNDGERAIEIEEEYNAQVSNIKKEIEKRPYDTDCASMSLRDMRAQRLRELEEHQ